MTVPTPADEKSVATPREILHTLRDILSDGEGGSAARVQAAKLLLDRIAPKQDEEDLRRETEERRAALAEARCLLAEFALAKSAGLLEPVALDQDRAAEPAGTTVIDADR